MNDKIKRRIKLVYDRIMNGHDHDSNEWKTAKVMFDDLCAKYGFSENDFKDSSGINDAEVQSILWDSKLNFTTIPQWFKIYCWIIAEVHECKAVVQNGKAVLFGQDLNKCAETMSYGIGRCCLTFSLLNTYAKGLKEPDYNLGFAYGFRTAIDEKNIVEMELDAQTESALIAISKKLAMAGQELARILTNADGNPNNNAKETTEKPDIKDEHSFNVGWLSGYQSYKKLLTA